ncbi:MAG: MBL fold metallo-hydrolase [Gammaproteobacteria bacterium]|nr:MBL fold metallo-hydrolase [Gammaproteobacteria bacterium]
MIFKQLFETDSSTFTYLIADRNSGKAVLIDPVRETVERDLQLLKDLELTLIATIETHVHADHLTGAHSLKAQTGCKIAYPAMIKSSCIDIGIKEGEPFEIGQIKLNPLYTPGHTDHHHAYLIETPAQKLIFTGDALLIEACGRTDFQSGSAEALYNSIHNKIFSLPDETLVYPGHDYEGRFITTVAQEKVRNPRLGGGKRKQEFIDIMNGLDLPYPRKIDFAVPGNEQCGICPDSAPEEMKGLCSIHDQG